MSKLAGAKLKLFYIVTGSIMTLAAMITIFVFVRDDIVPKGENIKETSITVQTDKANTDKNECSYFDMFLGAENVLVLPAIPDDAPAEAFAKILQQNSKLESVDFQSDWASKYISAKSIIFYESSTDRSLALNMSSKIPGETEVRYFADWKGVWFNPNKRDFMILIGASYLDEEADFLQKICSS